jgi:hypothetical protein
MKAVLHTIKEEALKAIPPTLFFFIIRHIVAFIRALMIKGTGISMPMSASVLIASLVLGKSVLALGHDRLEKMFLGPLPPPIN